MPLPTANVLSAIVTPLFPANSRRFYRLAIHYPGAGLRIPPQANPQTLSDRPVDPLPGVVYSPNSEVVKDGLPWWEVVGEASARGSHSSRRRRWRLGSRGDYGSSVVR